MSDLVSQNINMIFKSPKGETVHALKDVSFTLKKGELLTVLGPSGCGKTTLLNIAAGFLRPTSGSIILGDKEINGPGVERGMVFQQGALFEWLTVAENVNNLINDNTCQKLYADTNLLMNTEFGVRDFYTMPNSQVPNDQGAFVKWLYETPVSCALGDTGTLKQVRGCAFNNKSLSEIKEEIPKLFNEPIPAQ